MNSSEPSFLHILSSVQSSCSLSWWPPSWLEMYCVFWQSAKMAASHASQTLQVLSVLCEWCVIGLQLGLVFHPWASIGSQGSSPDPVGRGRGLPCQREHGISGKRVLFWLSESVPWQIFPTRGVGVEPWSSWWDYLLILIICTNKLFFWHRSSEAGRNFLSS